MAPRARNFRPQGTVRGRQRPICSPASSPRTRGSNRASGRQRQACSLPTAPTAPWSPPGHHSSTSIPSAMAPIPSTSVPRDAINGIRPARRGHPRRGPRRRLYRVRRRRGGRPLSATLLALDEVANIAPVPDLPAMVSEGRQPGGAQSWPACRTCPRPGAGGDRRPTVSSLSSAPRWCCPGSPTPGRCATSARWPASTRCRRRRPPAWRSDGGSRGRRPRSGPPGPHACPSTPSPVAHPTGPRPGATQRRHRGAPHPGPRVLPWRRCSALSRQNVRAPLETVQAWDAKTPKAAVSAADVSTAEVEPDLCLSRFAPTQDGPGPRDPPRRCADGPPVDRPPAQPTRSRPMARPTTGRRPSALDTPRSPPPPPSTPRAPPARRAGDRACAAGGCPAPRPPGSEPLGHAHPRRRPGIAQALQRARLGPLLAPAPNATTTSRRWAPPCGVSEITPA